MVDVDVDYVEGWKNQVEVRSRRRGAQARKDFETSEEPECKREAEDLGELQVRERKKERQEKGVKDQRRR